MSQWLTQKTVKYTNNQQRILAVNKKNLTLANIAMNDKRGQERKGGV